MKIVGKLSGTVLGLAVLALPVLGATVAVAAPEHSEPTVSATVADEPTGDDDDTPWG